MKLANLLLSVTITILFTFSSFAQCSKVGMWFEKHSQSDSRFRETNFTAEAHICRANLPGKILIDSIPNASYQLFRNGIKVQESKNASFLVNESGIYQTLVNTPNGCSVYTSKWNLNVTEGLSVSLNPFDDKETVNKICGVGYVSILSNIAILNNNYNNYPTYFPSYQWYKDGKVIDGANYQNYNTSEAGKYTLYIQDGKCSATSQPIEVLKSSLIDTVFNNAKLNIPDYGIIKEDIVLCDNLKATIFLNSIVGGDFNNPIWIKNDKPISKPQTDYNGSYIFGKGSAGKYYATIKGNNGCILKTQTITVVEKEKESSVVKIFNTASYDCRNQDSFIYLSSFSRDGLKNIEFYQGDKLVQSGTNTSLRVIEGGNYYVKGISENGCIVKSNVLNIKSFDKNDLAISLRHIGSSVSSIYPSTYDKNVVICPTNSIQLGITGIYLPNQAVTKFQWYKDGKAAGNNIEYSVKENGNYHLKMEENGCTYNSDTINVKVLSSNLITSTVKDVCEEGQVKFKVSPKPAGEFSWYVSIEKNGFGYKVTNSDKKEVLSNQSSPLYYYTVAADENLCVFKSNSVQGIGFNLEQKNLNPNVPNIACWGDSIKISATNIAGIESFQWFGPRNFKGSGQSIRIKKFETSGNFEVVGKGQNGCNYRTAIFVSVFKPIGLQPYHVNCDDISVIKFRTYDSDSTFASYSNTTGLLLQSPTKKVTSTSFQVPYFDLKALDMNISGKFNIRATQNSCLTNLDLDIDLNKKYCQGVKLVPLNKEIRLCPQSTYDVPFTSADMPAGTVYEVFFVNSNVYYPVRVGSGTSSPIKITIPYSYQNEEAFGFFIRTTDGKFQTETSDIRTFVVKGDNYTNIYVSKVESVNQLCSGKITYNASLPSEPILLQWLLDGKEIPSATTSTFAFDKSGYVSLKYSKTNGCTYLTGGENIKIGEIYQPYISSNGANSFCKNDVVSLTANSPYDYYQPYVNKVEFSWYKDGQLIADSKSKVFSPKESGLYSLKTSIENCTSVSSPSVKVNIDNNIPFTILDYLGQRESSFCKDQRLGYLYSTISNTGFQYQWQKDGVDIPNANSSDFTPKTSGVYNLKISKGTSCNGISNLVKVNISDKIKVKVNINTTNTCQGKENSIFINGIEDYFDSKYTINNTWYRDGVILPPNYRFLYTYQTGKFNILQKVYRSDTLICIVESDTLNVVSNNNFTKTALPVKTSSCQDSVQLESTLFSSPELGPFTHEWKKNNQIISKSNIVKPIYVKSSDTYTSQITYKDGCVVSSAPIGLTFGKFNPILETPYNNVCDGFGVTIYGYTGSQTPNEFYRFNTYKNAKFQWQKDDKDINLNQSLDFYLLKADVYESGKYVLKFSSDKCSGTSDPIDVNIIKLSEKLLPNADTASYCGQNLVELISDNPVTHQYKWELNEKPLSAFTQNLTTKTDGRYRVLIRKDGCARYSNTIVVNTDIVPNKLNIIDSTICGTKTIDLKAPVGAGINYTWEKDGKVIPDSPYGLFQAKESGTYRALLTKARCKVYSTDAKIKIKPLPDAMVTPEVTGIVYQPGTVKLNASVGTGYQYQWSKDSKVIDGAKSAVYEAKECGRYEVAVTLDGCVKQSGVIEVKIEIPLATENFINPSGISVYPNPSNGSFKIDLPNDLKNAPIQLFDNLGVEYNLTQDDEGKYWVKNLPQGKYLLRISRQEKSVGKHLVVEK
jgi:Secretion system C-terminal sorting domain